MTSSYQDDREWSDMFIPAIRQIVGPLLLVATPDLIDRREAADLMVFSPKPMMIGARIRAPGTLDLLPNRYPNQFTVRFWRRSGSETEFAKLRAGFCDWFFYGQQSKVDPTGIDRWFLIDLAKWRYCLDEAEAAGDRKIIKCNHEINRDGETSFLVFYLATFPISILVASSHDLDGTALDYRETFLCVK